MLRWTIPLERRVSGKVTITADEAAELYRRGFRFAIFQESTDEFVLSQPITTIVDPGARTVTIEQSPA